MTHPSADVRARYLRGLLPSAEFLAVDDHLAGCAECREAMAPPLIPVADGMRDAIAGEHLDYERMEAYVDGATADDEVEAHLNACEACAAEIEDLRTQPSSGGRWRQPPPLLTRAGSPGASGLRDARKSGGQRHRSPKWILWAAAAFVAFAILAAILTRRPADVPPVRVPAHTISTPPVRIEPVPVSVLSAALEPVLRQLAAGIVPQATLIEELRPAGERIRGDEKDSAELAVLEPYGIVEEDRPRFRWSVRRGAAYVVEVFDSTYRRVAQSEELSQGHWRPSRPVRRGAIYTWQVIEMRGDERVTAPSPPQPPARFKVISEAAYEELERARGAKSHLAAGLIYAREGVVDRALGELTLAEKENPRLPELPRAIDTLRRYQPAPTRTKPPQ